MQDDLTPPVPQPEVGHDASPKTRRKLKIRPGVVLALLVVAALIAFVVQNGSEVPVSWLFIEVDGPLWVVIVVSAVLGALLSEIIGWVVGHRRRRRHRS